MQITVNVPVDMPVTIPEEEPIVPIRVFELLHVPDILLLKVAVSPVHTWWLPLITGTGLTVMVLFTVQLPPSEYIMLAVPELIPVTMPLPMPTIATVVLLLVQVPKAMASLKVIEEPSHTDERPVITAGAGVTVITIVVVHPSV